MFSTNHAAVPSAVRSILTCPRCRSIEIEPITPIANASFRDAAETAWHDCWAGRRGLATRFLLRWACVTTANALRDKHHCRYCSHSFRDDR